MTLAQSGEKNPTVVGKYIDKSIHIVKLLLATSTGDKMALERAHLSRLDMNMGDYDSRTDLHLACCEWHLSCVKYLLQVCKVDPNCLRSPIRIYIIGLQVDMKSVLVLHNTTQYYVVLRRTTSY